MRRSWSHNFSHTRTAEMGKFKTVAKMAIIAQSNIQIPKHLNEEFFKKALESGLHLESDSFEIRNINFSMGSSGGDNYCSDIYRVVVTYTENIDQKEISLIVKSVREEMLRRLPTETKETQMYTEILPAIEKLTKSTFVPRLLYITCEPECTSYVFEDLVASGFVLKDRTVGLDENHTRAVLKKLGQFHAASMVLAQKKPEAVEFIQDFIFKPGFNHSNVMRELSLGNLAYITELARRWEGYEHISEKLHKLQETFAEHLLRCAEETPDRIRVINHGDMWINNFMFKYDAEHIPVDISLIDLQLSYYGSPGIDLNHFLNSSVQLDVIKTKRDELLQEYFEAFKTTLETLNYDKIPTFEDIEREIADTQFYGFWIMAAVFPLLTLNKDASKDNSLELFDDANATQKKREMMFKSSRVLETVKYSLKRFDQLGVLD